jgi:hypothetical protein
MEPILTTDVASLDPAHRSALEDVIGLQLRSNQQLVVRVVESEAAKSKDDGRPPQTINDLPNIFEGQSDEEIEATERDVKTRAASYLL